MTTSESASIFPPRLVSYVSELIAERAAKVREQREFNDYAVDEYEREQKNAQKAAIDNAIKSLTQTIIEISKKHFPDIELPENQELAISSILAALPDPEELVIKKVFHSSE